MIGIDDTYNDIQVYNNNKNNHHIDNMLNNNIQ